MALNRHGLEVGIFVALTDALIFHHYLPNLIDVQAAPPMDEDVEAAERKALITTSIFTVGVSALMRSWEPFIVGGGTVAVLDFMFKHANAYNPQSGSMQAAPGTQPVGANEQAYSLPDYSGTDCLMPDYPYGEADYTIPSSLNSAMRNFITFGYFYNWLNREQLGASSKQGFHAELPGDAWITWVQKHGHAGDVDLTTFRYGHYFAWQWFTAWLLTETGVGIGQALQTAVDQTGKAITTQILPGFGAGVAKVPGAKAASNIASDIPGLDTGLGGISDFFSRLSDPNTWIRVAEFLGGGLVLYVGIKALTTPGSQPVAKQTFKSTASHVKGVFS